MILVIQLLLYDFHQKVDIFGLKQLFIYYHIPNTQILEQTSFPEFLFSIVENLPTVIVKVVLVV